MKIHPELYQIELVNAWKRHLFSVSLINRGCSSFRTMPYAAPMRSFSGMKNQLRYFQKEKDSEKDIVRKLSIKYNLTNQEEKVLQLLVRGLNNQEIADDLFISVFTVKRHVASIYKKTSMNKKELVEECFIRTR